jgi:hypothetical protein
MNFNPQTAFRKQPMVYIAIALIIGIMLNELLNASSMLPFVAILLLILIIDKLADADYKILINSGEVIKSDVLKMTYPKQIPNNFNEFIQTVNAKMTIITGAKRSKISPTSKELSDMFNSELFFTDSVRAVWLFSNGKNKFEVKEWK